MNAHLKYFDNDQYLSGTNHNEFIVINTEVDSIETAEQECFNILEILTKPYIEEHREIDLKISIGYSILPDISQTAHELFTHSDMAKLEADRRGNDQISIYHESFYNQILKRIRIEKQLVNALKHEEFVLYYQPKVDMHTGDILGFEALIRWIKEDGTIIYPSDFIPTAEETELIIPIGAWVINEACNQIEKWNDMGYNYKVSVNVSTVQLESDFFIHTVKRALDYYNIKLDQLELEITETTVMHNIAECSNILRQLKSLGTIISLDDFGSGYSSMTYIRTLPISKIKIDRLFVEGIEKKGQLLLASSMIQIGKALDFVVNVEGVETLSQLNIIKNLGVDEVQGYFFSRPLPYDALMKYIKHAESNKIVIT
jgi:EAL domain-containing protein (putative c-di-GMP-specific phosphodiesterase class I)